MKNIVTLRKKPLKNGGYSLYLDMCKNGVRVKEYLKMYLLPPKDSYARDMNRATLIQAKTILAQRILEVQSNTYNLPAQKKKSISIDKLIEEYIRNHTLSYSYTKSINAIAKYFKSFFRKQSLTSLTKEDILRFRDYLRTKIMEPSINRYFRILSALFTEAVREGQMSINPMLQLTSREFPCGKTKEREYLTEDELRAMASIEGSHEGIKGAFLFSCYTGLRISDIKSLKWEHIKGNMIVKTMQKTKNAIYLPLSEQAKRYLPAKVDEYVFHLNAASPSKTIQDWADRAGVKKKVTFHVARHTFATLAISQGVDVYTVSELLGHTDIKTTQIYAKIVSSKKKTAMDSLPEL